MLETPVVGVIALPNGAAVGQIAGKDVDIPVIDCIYLWLVASAAAAVSVISVMISGHPCPPGSGVCVNKW
jgi:hypothetical protein